MEDNIKIFIIFYFLKNSKMWKLLDNAIPILYIRIYLYR